MRPEPKITPLDGPDIEEHRCPATTGGVGNDPDTPCEWVYFVAAATDECRSAAEVAYAEHWTQEHES